jgi:hypothetical protein
MFILLVIMAPLSTAFVVGLGTTRASEQDASNSADAQTLASFFDADVASAELVITTSADITCGDRDGVLELRWTDGTLDRRVAYEIASDEARRAELQLVAPVYAMHRVVCTGTGGPTNDQTLAQTLSAAPSISCDSASCTTRPRTVTMKANAHSTQISDAGSATTYSFGVTATRKVQP